MFMTLIHYNYYSNIILYSVWLFCNNLNGMGQHLIFLLSTMLFFILQFTHIIVITNLFYSIWILCIKLSGMGKHLNLLPTTKLFSILHCNNIIVIILIFYLILLF